MGSSSHQPLNAFETIRKSCSLKVNAASQTQVLVGERQFYAGKKNSREATSEICNPNLSASGESAVLMVSCCQKDGLSEFVKVNNDDRSESL